MCGGRYVLLGVYRSISGHADGSTDSSGEDSISKSNCGERSGLGVTDDGSARGVICAMGNRGVSGGGTEDDISCFSTRHRCNEFLPCP